MEQINLTVEKRKGVGKSIARQLRRSGTLPGIIYGRDVEAIPVQVPQRTIAPLLKAYEHGHHAILNLTVVDEGDRLAQVPALIQDVQIDPISREPLTIDFHAVSLTENVTTQVMIHLQGEPVGVKNEGGILEHSLWEVQVECLPTMIPESIVVDIAGLHLNDVLHVRDLPVPQGVALLDDPDAAVVSVVPPAAIRERVEEAVAEEVSEVEVE